MGTEQRIKALENEKDLLWQEVRGLRQRISAGWEQMVGVVLRPPGDVIVTDGRVIKPETADGANLGSVDNPFNTVFASNFTNPGGGPIIATEIVDQDEGANIEAARSPTANMILALDGSAQFPDSVIPSSIARDTEITAAISSHEAAGDPHPGYMTPAEHAAIGNGYPHHTPVTIGSGGLSGKLSLSTQELTLAAINHSDLGNIDANQHIDHTAVSISAGGILSGGGTIAANRTITLNHNDVDHDQTTNFVANEHINHTSVSINAGGILSGGGTIAANRTITLNHSDVDHNQTTNYVGNQHIDHSVVSIAAGSGLTGGGTIVTSRTITLGTPSTLSASTSNGVTSTSHTHAITTTSDGDTDVSTILASDANGGLRLDRLGINVAPTGTELRVNADIVFVGAQKITTTASDLTLQPTGDLLLDPTGNNVQLTSSVTISTDNYVSQTTGWAVTYAGAADFRNIFADEMHVQAFVADINAAMAGAIILTKSRARLSRNFTIPNTSSSATLYVEDLEGQPDTAVFASGDYVLLQAIDTSGGGMVVTEVYGQVTSYSDLSGGEQSWTFTTTTTSYSAADTVYAGSIALDYGQTGSGSTGVWEATVLDAAGSPYTQVQTWDTITSGEPSNFTTWVRTGNLNGITSVEEYGIWIGQNTTDTYLLLSDQNFEIHGIDLKLYDGATVKTQILHDEGILVSSGTWGTNTTVFAAVFANDATVTSLDAGDVIIGVPLHGTATSRVGVHWDNSASSLSLLRCAIDLYDGATQTVSLQADGDFFIGANVASASTTSLAVLSKAQTYASVSYGAGDILIGNPVAADNEANIWWDASAGTLSFRGGTTVQVYVDTDGSVNAGGGKVALDNDGIKIDAATSDSSTSFRFMDGASAAGYFYLWDSSAVSDRYTMTLFVEDYPSGYGGRVRITGDGATSAGDAEVRITGAGTLGTAQIDLEIGGGDQILILNNRIDFGVDVYIDGDIFSYYDTDTYIDLTSTADQMSFYAGSVEILRLVKDATDYVYFPVNVGIGKTPDVNLHIYEASANADFYITVGDTSHVPAFWFANNYAVTPSWGGVGLYTDNSLRFSTTGSFSTSTMIISDSDVVINGHLGVGDSAPSPGAATLYVDADGNPNSWAMVFYGDTTTSQSYGAVFVAGTNSTDVMLDLRNTSNVTKFRVRGDGCTYIGDTSNAGMTLGLTINQGAYDNEILAFKSSDVTHGITNYAETDTYGAFRKWTATQGGLIVDGFCESRYGIQLRGWVGSYQNTKTTGSWGSITLAGYYKSGTGYGNYPANSNVVVIRATRNSTTETIAIWDEDGDYYYLGTLNSYDDYDDALAVRDAAQILAGKWNQTLEYNKDDLAAMGVITLEGNGDIAMVSHKRMTALMMGAIGQSYSDRQEMWAEMKQLRERCQRYELALDKAGLLPAAV